MKDERISVVYKHPGQPAKMVIIPNTLEALQTLVGGYVEEASMFYGSNGQPFLVLCDEDGKLRRKDVNITLYYDWHFDFVVGDVVIARTERRVLVDMTPQDCEDARDWLTEAEA